MEVKKAMERFSPPFASRLLPVLLTLASLSFSVSAVPQTLSAHPWQGKRVAYLGDSITDPRNKASKKKYWGFLSDWLHGEAFVYGVSGRTWSDIPRQVSQCYDEHGDSVDAIVIFMGTNDYNKGVPLGEWFTETPEKVMAAIGGPKALSDRLRRHPVMADSTYRGRINIALDKVKRLYPTKQIVLLTPLHRGGFYPNDNNWQPTEVYTNLCGEYLDAYSDAVTEGGRLWAVPVVDWSSSCGLFPLMDEYAQYFNDAGTDRLHPNEKGHRRLAQTLYYQLLSLPCTFY